MYQPFCLLLINFIKLNFMESQQLKFQIFFDFLSNLIENLIFFFWIQSFVMQTNLWKELILTDNRNLEKNFGAKVFETTLVLLYINTCLWVKVMLSKRCNNKFDRLEQGIMTAVPAINIMSGESKILGD